MEKESVLHVMKNTFSHQGKKTFSSQARKPTRNYFIYVHAFCILTWLD